MSAMYFNGYDVTTGGTIYYECLVSANNFPQITNIVLPQ